MGEERRTVEDRKYAVLSKDSVRMFAESVGYADIPEEIASLLAEDVTYRLREAVQHSCHFLRHSRRKKLTSEDVNKALRNSDTPPLFGHGTQEMLPFRRAKEGDLFFVEELDINLSNIANSNQPCSQVMEPSMKAYWLAVEGAQKPGSIPQALQAKVNVKTSPGISEDLLQYYDNVTKAILGNDEEIMKLALVDLRTNSKISPLMPYFINFFHNGVRTVNHDITQLTKLLHTVRALINNQSLNLEPKPYLDMLVQGVLHCVTDQLAAAINPLNDHWKLRDYAARLLAQITKHWETPLNNLRERNINSLKDVLYDLSKSFCSHYGAVMGLLAFGTQAIEDVLLPHLPSFWLHIQAAIEDNNHTNASAKADAHKLHGAILLAAEYVLKARIENILTLNLDSDGLLTSSNMLSSPAKAQQDTSAITDISAIKQQTDTEANVEPTTSTPIKSGVDPMDSSDLVGPILELSEATNPYKELMAMYKQLSEYFGDSLSDKFPVRHITGIYVLKPKVVEPPLLSTEVEGMKTGEELLHEFLVTAEELDMKSENHSIDPTPDDMDYDLEEKSERSERSSRSSRSDRSHSDENLSFMGEDTDLTVINATVSDPSQGIKLTILKRPKLKVAEFSMDEEDENETKPVVEDESMPVLEAKPATLKIERPLKISKPKDVSEVFEIEPMIKNDVFFLFRYFGLQHLCTAKRNTNRCRDGEQVHPKSEVKNLSKLLRIYGKQKASFHTKKRRRKTPLHLYTGNIANIL